MAVHSIFMGLTVMVFVYFNPSLIDSYAVEALIAYKSNYPEAKLPTIEIILKDLNPFYLGFAEFKLKTLVLFFITLISAAFFKK